MDFNISDSKLSELLSFNGAYGSKKIIVNIESINGSEPFSKEVDFYFDQWEGKYFIDGVLCDLKIEKYGNNQNKIWVWKKE